MPISIKSIAACGCLLAVLLAAGACSPRRIPPMTITDLMEDKVALDGVLMKCDRDLVKARADTDCQNARIAVERLAARHDDPADEAKRQEEFERSREQLRAAQEKQRAAEEAKKPKVDVYNMPVLPVDPTPPPQGTPPATQPQSTIVGQTKP